MTMNLKSWGLLTLALVLPSCLLDFDGYRERPADGGGNGGNGAAGNAGGNGGAANGASGGGGGAAAGGSGNTSGSGGSAAGGSGGDAGAGAGGSGNASSGGTGNVAGSSGAAGNGGSAGAAGCSPHDATACGPGMSCQFLSAIKTPFDYATHCVPEGTGIGTNGCRDSDSTQCAAPRLCYNGSVCYRWCRLGYDDCAVCGAVCEQIINPTPTIGSVQYGLCSFASC